MIEAGWKSPRTGSEWRDTGAGGKHLSQIFEIQNVINMATTRSLIFFVGCQKF